jgi:hypothetical protein
MSAFLLLAAAVPDQEVEHLILEVPGAMVMGHLVGSLEGRHYVIK